MPRQGLNRRLVLEAALRLVDEQGLEELTMRRLAEELGVEAPSLYKHVSGKPAILEGLIELVYEEVTFDGVGGSFRDRVGAYASSFRAALLRHPQVVPLVATRPVTDAATLSLVEVALEEMSRLGFELAEGRMFLNVAVGFVIGHALSEVGARSVGAAELMAARRAAANGELPHVRRTLASEPVDHDGEFELGISLIVDAIERESARV